MGRVLNTRILMGIVLGLNCYKGAFMGIYSKEAKSITTEEIEQDLVDAVLYDNEMEKRYPDDVENSTDYGCQRFVYLYPFWLEYKLYQLKINLENNDSLKLLKPKDILTKAELIFLEKFAVSGDDLMSDLHRVLPYKENNRLMNIKREKERKEEDRANPPEEQEYKTADELMVEFERELG
jgi:hypothetical protein